VTSNKFNVDRPVEYACTVRKFSGRSFLHIEAVGSQKPRDRFYIVFYPVEYFSGPITWGSVNFCLASEEEAVETFKLIERYTEIPPEELLGSKYGLKLYTVTMPQNTIRIVAHDAIKHTDEWAVY
jgi:hypothetical protein